MSQILWMMSFSATDDDVTTTNDESIKAPQKEVFLTKKK